MSEKFEQRRTRPSASGERVCAGSTRREFLRAAGSVGYVGVLAHGLGVDDVLAAGSGPTEVATALVRTDPSDPWSLTERTREVPENWYRSVQKAFSLNELLARSQITGYLGSAVVPGSYDEGTATVSIGLSSESKTLQDILSLVDDDVGVDLKWVGDFEEVPGDREAEPRHLDGAGDGIVPSGVAVESESSLATVGPALYDDGGGPFFATAEHAFDRAEGRTGQLLYLRLNDDEEAHPIGSVRAAHPVADIVAAEPTGAFEPGRMIDGPTRLPVTGQYTRWGLASLIARDEPLQKVGAMTGHTSGAIQGIDAITCFTADVCRRGQIRWGGEMDLIDGDSGSVSYHPDPEAADDGVLIAGLNNARTWWPGQSYVWGAAAYHLFERLGYHF